MFTCLFLKCGPSLEIQLVGSGEREESDLTWITEGQRLSACLHAKSLRSCTTLRPMGCIRQAPLSVGLSRQECWSGWPCTPPGDLPDLKMEPSSLMPLTLVGRFFTSSATWEAQRLSTLTHSFILLLFILPS